MALGQQLWASNRLRIHRCIYQVWATYFIKTGEALCPTSGSVVQLKDSALLMCLALSLPIRLPKTNMLLYSIWQHDSAHILIVTSPFLAQGNRSICNTWVLTTHSFHCMITRTIQFSSKAANASSLYLNYIYIYNNSWALVIDFLILCANWKS